MKSLFDPNEQPWEHKVANLLKLLSTITLMFVIALYIVLFVYFQRLVRA